MADTTYSTKRKHEKERGGLCDEVHTLYGALKLGISPNFLSLHRNDVSRIQLHIIMLSSRQESEEKTILFLQEIVKLC